MNIKNLLKVKGLDTTIKGLIGVAAAKVVLDSLDQNVSSPLLNRIIPEKEKPQPGDTKIQWCLLVRTLIQVIIM